MELTQENVQGMSLEDLSKQMAKRNTRVNTSISADDLAQTNGPTVLTPPTEATPVDVSGTVGAVSNELGGIISAQTEEAKQLNDLRNQYAALGDEGTLSELFSQQQKEFGIPENMRQLKDIQLQLADMQTESGLLKTQIAGKAGQTTNAGRRALTQENREAAVRQAGLAAQASVLTGNIETASALVNQAVNIAYQDRTLRNQNLINQINDLRGTVDQQTQQLLDKEERKYQEDQRQIMRAEAAVDSAVASGYATGQEIQKLVELSGDPAMQRDYAYGIVARGAVEDRLLEQQQQRLSMEATRASIAASSTSRRRNLVELGLTGDPQAIAELGFDPRTQLQEEVEALEAEEKAQMEIAAGKENERLQGTLDQLTELMGNKTGLEASSGQFRNATISGFTPLVGDSISEISGGGFGAVRARTEKDDWLATMGNVLTQDGFEALIEVNERVRLTPITNAEIALAFKSAGELQNAAIYKGSADEGTQRIVGFRMSEDEVRKNLAQMYLATQKAQEEAAYINQYGYDGLLELQQLQAEAQSEQ